MAKTVTHKENVPHFGDGSLLEIAPISSFSSMIFEILSEKKPDTHQIRLFETILNISIDHGPNTPSAIETIKAAKNGKSISESVAEGIKQINNTHGGAIKPAMKLFYKIDKEKLDIKEFVKKTLDKGEKLPGFGHRIYKVDPRSELLFDLSKKEGLDPKFINVAQKIAKELKEQKGKSLPVNIDGSIAAVLCTFGWDSKLGKAVFIIARTPGLCGQYINAT